ncbi:MAG TPA: hypothetical protein ENI34_00930 [candidate division WOR-3 bacterium]|uniref:Uncharacterized protein n=1 Tax=candidate division WOR-3 bacterium TaxID=2052148 RepID=A0A9C9EKR5_UNCW3|nr:hypothetical protein [candidate division WOR-3 bacterium]
MILFFLCVLGINQNQFDAATAVLRSYFNCDNTVATVGSRYYEPSEMACGARLRYLNNYEIQYTRGDIIIGDQAAETLYVTGYFYNNGNIIIINDGVLNVKNADFNLDGNIMISNSGKAFIDSSSAKFLQHYIYQYIISVVDSGYFSLTNADTRFNGYPINVFLQGDARIFMDNVVNQDWITAVIFERGNVFLNDVGITGEWLFDHSTYAEFHNVNNLLTWYFFNDSSLVDFVFPAGDTVYGYYFDSTLSGVSGVGYHVEIDSSTDCMWAVIPLRGSDITINDSELRVTGLMFEGVDSFDISGLVNGLHYNDYVLPITDRNYHLINTSVQTWNLYPSDSSYVHLTSSIFGELCGFANSYTVIENAFCDGSGGHIEASSNAFVCVVLSSIMTDVITKDHGICFLGYCSMPLGHIWITGSSVGIIVNSQFPEEPVVSDTSIVFVAAVTAPSEASVDDTVGIIGSAWVDVGPYQPLDFDHYQLFYRLAGDSVWSPVAGQRYVEVRWDTLDYWNTAGLVPGDYEVRLVLKDTAGDSVEALKQIRLTAQTVVEKRFPPVLSPGVEVKRLGPRLFYIDRGISKVMIDIYDITGRKVHQLREDERYWKAPGSGIYFLKGGDTPLSEKLVAF